MAMEDGTNPLLLTIPDNTNTMKPVFFTTEDDEAGAMRRFVADGNGWDALHSDGDESFLRIIDDNTTNGRLTRMPHGKAPPNTTEIPWQ